MKNSLKVLLLSSLLAATLAGCNDDKPSNSESVTGSESVTDSESSSTSNSESENPTPTIPQVKLDLTRKIYLKSEIDERKEKGEPLLDYTGVGLWSSALQDYTPFEGVPQIIIEEGTGVVNAKVIVGSKFADIEVEVYETAEDAAEAHPVSSEDLETVEFKESKYIDVNKKEIKIDTYFDEQTNKLYSASQKQPINYINDTIRMLSPQTYTWAAKMSFMFDSTESNTNVSTLDPTRKTVPHEAVEWTVEKTENPNLPQTDVITKVNYSSTYNFLKNTSYTYDKILNSGGLDCSNVGFSSELILDADGNICYVGVNYNGNAGYTHTSLVDVASWYCSPIYQNNDYSTVEGAQNNTNPAFVFADDYDPNDEEKKYHFEKVVPEGGYYIIDVNNYYGSQKSSIDAIMADAYGDTSNLSGLISSGKLDRATAAANENLSNTKVLYKNNKVNSYIKYTKSIVTFQPSDTYETYAYYYQLALKSGDETLLAKRDEVYNSIVYQEVNFIKSEKILLDYYAAKTDTILKEWADAFGLDAAD